MREHRDQRAVKDPVQERLAFGPDAIGLFDQRPVEVGAALLLKTDGALLDQPRQERAHGFACHFRLAESRAMTSRAKIGDPAQTTFMTCHSAGEICG